MNNNTFDKKEQHNKSWKYIVKGIIYIVIGIFIIILGYYVGLIVSTPRKILREVINPAINEYKEKNKKVLKGCLISLDERLKECEAGIDPFLEDITSLRTKVGIIWNWAFGDKEKYIQNKFERYVLSKEKLNEIVNDVIKQCIEGANANFNKMYLQIKEDIVPITSRFNIPESVVESFVQQSFKNALADIQDNTHKILMNAIISYGASELGSVILVKGGSIILGGVATQLSLASVSESILVPALSMAGVNLTSTLAGTGGGFAVSTTTGTSIGSVIPGLGTIIGSTLGVVVGYIIEERLDSNFRKEMKPKIVASLDEIKKQIKNSFEKEISVCLEQYIKNLQRRLEIKTHEFYKGVRYL